MICNLDYKLSDLSQKPVKQAKRYTCIMFVIVPNWNFFEGEFMGERLSPKDRRHNDNLGKFTGMYNGVFRANGKTPTGSLREREKLESTTKPRIEGGVLKLPDNFKIPQGGITLFDSGQFS